MGLWLRKLEISRFGDFVAILQLRNEGAVLRNDTRVLRGGFAAVKIFTEGGLGLRNDFAVKWRFRRGLFGAAKIFSSKGSISQWPSFGFEISQTTEFSWLLAPFSSKRLSFILFANSPTLDHSKRLNYIEIHNLRSNLKLKEFIKLLN